MRAMHTVIETTPFLKPAEKNGMSDAERQAVVDFIAADPTAGDEIPHTGGCRKVRFAGKGKGKSGGYRVITFYSGADIPVVLLTTYAKNVRVNLSADECATMKRLTKVFVTTYKERRRQ